MMTPQQGAWFAVYVTLFFNAIITAISYFYQIP